MDGLETELYEASDSDPDAELQEAFAQGLLKPGLYIEEEAEKKVYINNEASIKNYYFALPTEEIHPLLAALKQMLESFILNLPWIERLDLNTVPAPMAPELAAKLEEQKENVVKGKINDIALNDFEREMTFHRQAQAAVIKGISQLKELGVFTKRPDDYFAEMAKSDGHMQKVRSALLQKQHSQERSEKVRQIRQMRKINKELQKQARVKKESEKKEFLDQVKMFRKKMTDNLDFLDAKPKAKPKVDLKKVKKPLNRRAERKKKMKEQYGYGGRKKGNKRNTKESTLEIKTPLSKDKGKGWKGKHITGGKKPVKGKQGKGSAKHRPGKERRKQMKNRGGKK